MTKVQNIESFNQGIDAALKIFNQNFFAGNIAGGDRIIAQIQSMRIVSETENGVEVKVPDNVPTKVVNFRDILTES